MDSPIPVILVTGSSRGLGRGIAVELARSGFSVAVNYAGNAAAAAETVTHCRQAAVDDAQCFVPLQGDVADPVSRRGLLERTLGEFGRIDGLVNNAGIGPKTRADITEASEESFEALMRTNLQGPYFLTQAVVNHWLRDRPAPAITGGFKIIFVTSISVHTASVSRGEYCVSKAGLSMAAQLWAARLAAEGVQVIELRPGIMKTDMTSAVTEKYDRLISGGLVPQRRWGTAEDLGRAAAAVMEDRFPFSTGTVIDVDGGFQMRTL